MKRKTTKASARRKSKKSSVKRKATKRAASRPRLSFEDAIIQRASSTKKRPRPVVHPDHTASEFADDDGSPLPQIHFTDVKPQSLT